MIIGDIVVRKSYDKDITFKVVDIKNNIAILKGINIRIIADSNIEDLEKAETEEEDHRFMMGSADVILNRRVNEVIKNVMNRRKELEKRELKDKEEMSFGRPGRILHIDGDSEYMETCLKVYKQLRLDAIGRCIPENEQPERVLDIVKEVKPDIVVLTGHDSVMKSPEDYLDIDNYRNSKYFLKSVENLRNYNASYDELVIFAGACQSCYERILDKGANFASSPNRILIHCLDPVFICEKIAYTKISEVVSVKEVIDNTITGIKGIGGIQTRGKYREGYPKSFYV